MGSLVPSQVLTRELRFHLLLQPIPELESPRRKDTIVLNHVASLKEGSCLSVLRYLLPDLSAVLRCDVL